MVGLLRGTMWFVRGSALCGTWTVAVVGAATAGTPSSFQAVPVITVATAFHVFAYVLNDVVDLPLDRTEPRRRNSPLVTGSVSRSAAAAVALACLPLGMAVARVRSTAAVPTAALALAYLGMTGYDLWGKRLSRPIVTDVVQGLSWAGLLVWAATASGPVTATTALLGAYVTVLIVLTNGVHGAVRDLENDLACEARTTAILLGARPLPDGGITAPIPLVRYAASLQACLTLLGLACAVVVTRGSGPLVGATVTAVVGVLLTASGVLAWHARHVFADGAVLRHVGLLHLSMLLLVPLVVTAPTASTTGRWVAAAVFVLPLALHVRLWPALRWLARPSRLGSPRELRAADERS